MIKEGLVIVSLRGVANSDLLFHQQTSDGDYIGQGFLKKQSQ